MRLPVLLLSITLALAGRQNGINFLNDAWSPVFPYNTTQALTSLDKMVADTGTNTISVSVMYYQWSVDSTGPIYPMASTTTDDNLKMIADLAHARGLTVMLRPGVDNDWHNPNTTGTWRGQIGRNFTAQDWSTWFGSYQAYIVRYASLAAKYGIEQVAIGFELVTANDPKNTPHWRQLIAAVRNVYKGSLTYCANHDDEEHVEWWDALDFIGVDAYYMLLINTSDPTVDQLIAQWQPIVTKLEALSVKFGNKPIIFGEVGYCSAPLTHWAPWALNCGGTTVDLQEQVNCYEALFQVFYNKPWFAGLYIWGWVTDPNAGGSKDSGFTPNNKPGAAVLKHYFTDADNKLKGLEYDISKPAEHLHVERGSCATRHWPNALSPVGGCCEQLCSAEFGL